MRNHKGFTLLEMIMVIILIGIVAAVIAMPLAQGVKGWFAATSREGISQSGRIGIERMAREIRNTARIDSNPVPPPASCLTTFCATPPCYCPCISQATSTVFKFSTNDITNTDLTRCDTTEFSLLGSNIQRITRVGGVITETANLADNVQTVTGLAITYYNSANTAFNPTTAALRATICRLSIEITSQQGGETLLKYEEVYLANMRGTTNAAQRCQTMNQ